MIQKQVKATIHFLDHDGYYCVLDATNIRALYADLAKLKKYGYVIKSYEVAGFDIPVFGNEITLH